jgi:uncharacterized protein
VKSMAGGGAVRTVRADVGGLVGDRVFALVDRRPPRDGEVLSARTLPGILRWSAAAGPGGEPVLTGPDGRSGPWSSPRTRERLERDLGIPLGLAGPGSYPDLANSVLITTEASHRAVERGYGRPVDARRWRTNLHLVTSAPAFAEHGWEGRVIAVGEVVLRLLHPCGRCAIPTWAPDGSVRDPGLLRWLLGATDGRFGINARVERPGLVAEGDVVRLL